MANRFTEGKRAIAECDRCGFRFKLHDLKKLVVKTKQINMLVCSECWEEDHPQLQLGMYPIADPQALRDPRPDFAGYPESRDIQWGWNPVGGGNGFVGTPNTLQGNTALGSVAVVTLEDTIASPAGLSMAAELGTPTVNIILPYLFYDTFTGAAGPLSGHTADTGQSWVNAAGSTVGITDLQLNGSGELRATNVSFKAAGVNLNLTTGTLTITVDVVVPSLAFNISAYFYIANNIANPTSSTYTRFLVACLTTGQWRTEITDNAGSTFLTNVPGGLFGVGTRTFTFVINGSGKQVYLGTTGGTLIDTRSQVSTFTNAGLILETAPNAGGIGVSSIAII